MSVRRALPAAAFALAAAAGAARAASLLPPADGAARAAALERTGVDAGGLSFRVVAAKKATRDTLPEVRIEVRRAGKRVYRTGPAMLWSLIDVRDDIAGDGRPLAVLGSYSGGAHCCVALEFLTLDARPQRFATLYLGNGDVPEAAELFVDADGDGRIDLNAYDQSFAYWIVSFAESPFQPIVLHWTDGRFRLNAAAMKRPPMDDAAAAKAADAVLADDSWRARKQPPPLLWQTMMAEVFAGNAPNAWAFAARAWPAAEPGRDAFVRDFRDQLKTSPWWPDLVTMNPAGL